MALSLSGLHWTRALLFPGSYVTFYCRDWFTEEKSPEGWAALQLHFTIGITVAVLVVLRIIGRITNRVPDLEAVSKLEHLAAYAGAAMFHH